MAESKNSKYIITERKLDSRDAALPAGVDPESVSNTKSHRKILSLDDMVLKGASYTEVVWMWPGGSDVYPETPEPSSHAHDYDETIGFFGTDLENPYELHGEIEFWIANEEEAGYCGKFLFLDDGQTCPGHKHALKHETFYIVKGRVRMVVDDSEIILDQGDVLTMPTGARHQFSGVGPALVLEVSMPSIRQDSFFDDRRIAYDGVL